jgi:hypothetical protein
MLEERTPHRALSHPELVASHYAQAGLAEKAIDYWDKAGRLAVNRSMMAQAAANSIQRATTGNNLNLAPSELRF